MSPDEKTQFAKVLTLEYMKAHPEIYQKNTDEIVKIFNDKLQEFKKSLTNTYINDWYSRYFD